MFYPRGVGSDVVQDHCIRQKELFQRKKLRPRELVPLAQLRIGQAETESSPLAPENIAPHFDIRNLGQKQKLGRALLLNKTSLSKTHLFLLC